MNSLVEQEGWVHHLHKIRFVHCYSDIGLQCSTGLKGIYKGPVQLH